MSGAGSRPAGAEGLLDLLAPGIDAWNTGDLDVAIQLIDPGITWYSARAFPDIDPVYHGHDGVRKFWATFVEPWEEIQLEIVEVLGHSGDVDAGVLAVNAHFHARGREGVVVDLDVFQVFTVEDRKLVEFRVFLSAGEALEAAGLG